MGVTGLSYIYSTATLSVLFASLFGLKSIINNRLQTRFLTVIIFSVCLWRITFREVFGDTLRYVLRFKDMWNVDLKTALELYNGDRLFLIFTWIIAKISHSQEVFLMLVGVLFLLYFYKFLSNIFTSTQLLFVMTSYSLYPFFVNYSTNTIRQGIAISLLLYAMTFYLNDKKEWRKTIIVLAASFLFHWSALPFGIILIVMKMFELSLKTSLFICSITVFLYLLSMQTRILAPIINRIPKMDFYGTIGDGVNRSGNRMDFFIFTVFGIFAGLFLYKYLFRDSKYEKLIKIYILFSSVFFLLGFIAYSDRIAAYSWFLLPIILWIPVFNQVKHRTMYSFLLLFSFVVVGFITGILPG
jgi:hypothetical protein